MPAYPHLADAPLAHWDGPVRTQAERIQVGLAAEGADVPANSEVIAVIAYLQALDHPHAPPPPQPPPPPAPPPPDPSDPARIAAGAAVYAENCAMCHGRDQEGVIGSNLRDDEWTLGGTFDDILHVTREDVPAEGMPPWKGILSGEACIAVAAFVWDASRKPSAPASP